MTFLCAFLVTLAAAFGAQGNDRPKSADQLWAEALWKSLPSNDASSDEIKALLVAALARTKNKAPIYVALADIDSGPARLREMFDELVRVVEDEAEAELDKNPVQVDPSDPEAAASILADLLRDSYRKAVQKKSVSTSIDGLSKLMRDGSDSSLVYYVAAIAEDPRYKIAWYRLAKRATGDLSVLAIDGFIRNDPDSAMPYFIRAAVEVKAGDLAAALQSVKVGNAKPACRWYEAEVPKDFELYFPETEEFQELGVNGKRFSRSGLRYMLKRYGDAFSFTDAQPRELSDVARDLLEEGERLQAEGRLQDARMRFEAVREMGALLMRVQPRDGLLMVTGLGISRMPRENLREVYESQNDSEQLKRFERFEAARKSFYEQFSTALRAMKPTNDDLKLILTGEKDGLAEERKLLESTLRESGLLDALDPKRPK